MKTTKPLAKAITTLEGQIVVAINVLLALGAAIPGHLIPSKYAVIVAGVMNVALIAQRAVVKVKASKAQADILNAINNGKFDAATVESLLTELLGV